MPEYAIDSHAHVFHRGLKLAEGRRYEPDYDAPVDAYLRQLDENEMTHGVLVQPSFLGTDNSYLIECLAAAAGRLKGVAVVDQGVSPHALRRLDAAGVVGIRLNLIGQSSPDITRPEWRALLMEIVRRGWHVEIQHSAAELAIFCQGLLDHGLNVVLDHFTLPDPNLGVRDPGFSAILKLRTQGRLWVKVSAPYRSGPRGEAIACEAYPWLRDALGANRLMWGSDWPHTQFETSQTYQKARIFLNTLIADAQERAMVLDAPRALYQF